MPYPPGFIEDTIRIIINNLNDDREHLGLQLALAQGMISKQTYNSEKATYLIRSHMPHQDLLERAKILKRFVGSDISAEIIMTSFRCTIEEANAVMGEL